MNQTELKEKCEALGFDISEELLNKLDKYSDLLKQWNEKMNLTAIVEKEEVYEKHFFDSILGLNKSVKGKVADVGSGAGFPGLVWKIIKPELSIDLIEPTGKRCIFLSEVIQQLGLKDITVYNTRAEEHVKQHREQYDVVTARAVANLRVLSELCVPLVKKGGTFLVMKGSHGQEEVNEASKALKTLGVQQTSFLETSLVNGDPREIFTFTKVENTPFIYPRNYGQIKKKPL